MKDLYHVVIMKHSILVVRSQKLAGFWGLSNISFVYVVLLSDFKRLHLLQTAFRTKAMEVHPDQNQDDRGA